MPQEAQKKESSTREADEELGGFLGSEYGAMTQAPPPEAGMGGGGGMGGGMPGSMGSPIGMGAEMGPPGGGLAPEMTSGPNALDPMTAARDQFQSLITQIEALAQQYPMAEQQFTAVNQMLLEALVSIAKQVQPEPMAPAYGV